MNEREIFYRIDICDLDGRILAHASKRFRPNHDEPAGVEAAVAKWRTETTTRLTAGLVAGTFRIHVKKHLGGLNDDTTA